MFNSLAQTWRNVTTNSSDFKELVPEFYDTAAAEPGDFLLNKVRSYHSLLEELECTEIDS